MRTFVIVPFEDLMNPDLDVARLKENAELQQGPVLFEQVSNFCFPLNSQ